MAAGNTKKKPDDPDETMVTGDAAAPDDDLEAQMAAAMAAEGMGSDDDLEAQMAAAMAGAIGDPSDDDLEAQMAAAMAADAGPVDDAPRTFGAKTGDGRPSISKVDFQQLAPSDEAPSRDSIDRLMDITLILSVELGRKQLQIKEILTLGPGKIIELDKLAGEPVDLMVNGKMLAKGEVVVVDENFGVRITELIDPVDRVRML